MKKLFAIVIGFCFVALWGNIALCVDDRGPRMTVEEREFDFKEVKEGTTLEHAFIITNKGNEPLEIISVRPG